MISLSNYLVLAAVLFSIGLFGVITKRNAIAILMGIELMLNAVNINLVAFSRFIEPSDVVGQIFAVFTIVVAAAEVAVGLAIIIALARARQTIDAEELHLLKW